MISWSQLIVFLVIQIVMILLIIGTVVHLFEIASSRLYKMIDYYFIEKEKAMDKLITLGIDISKIH